MYSTRSFAALTLLLSLTACGQPVAPGPSEPMPRPTAQSSPVPVTADIRTEVVTYRQGDQELEGYLAYDANATEKRPGVLVIHEWTGLNDYTKRRARELAELGYVAFAADIYGKGIRPEAPAEAGQEARKYYSDRDLAKARATAGYEVLRNHERVNPDKTAAMGYCFGGAMTLELARSGAPLDGFVSFHGGLRPTVSEGQNIEGKVLVLHGADDPTISAEDITGFQQEMRSGGVDWQMVYYSGAVHAFTNPDSGNDPSRGSAYNANADRRSWEDMQDFFQEIFAD